MKINIETENNNIKSVNLNLNPLEFAIMRKIFNLTCVYTELNETDGQTAAEIYKTLDGELKKRQRL
jgi:hypothetical protein